MQNQTLITLQKGIECTSQPDSVHFSQCYESGSLDENTQYIIINQLDNRVVQMSETGAAQMATRDDTNMSQRWMLKAEWRMGFLERL